MSAAERMINGVERPAQVLHGVIRADPDDGNNVLIADHADLRRWAPIPVSAVAEVRLNGVLNGLDPNWRSVDLVLQPSFQAADASSASLVTTLMDNKASIVPVYCYDAETHERVPCPR